MDTKLEDFGEKIGGARKDIWRARGLNSYDLSYMNEAEKRKFVNKNSIWNKPNYEELVHNGVPVRTVYFMKTIRDAAPSNPIINYNYSSAAVIDEKQKGYTTFMSKLRDATMSLKSDADVTNFHRDFISQYTIKDSSYYIKLKPEAYDCISNKLLKASQVKSFSQIDQDIQKKQFCYTEEQKKVELKENFLNNFKMIVIDSSNVKMDDDRMVLIKTEGSSRSFYYIQGEEASPELYEKGTVCIVKDSKVIARNIATISDAYDFLDQHYESMVANTQQVQNSKETRRLSKTKFVPKQLEDIQRDGIDYRNDRNVEGINYLKKFNFYGGEFGNWLNEHDRQVSLNYGYDALLDLSSTLGIDPKDISLGNRLSIAFGSRGHGSAVAHYEVEREVINLTKMKGAGSLAHEWAHALDDLGGKALGLRGAMTQFPSSKSVPVSFQTLIDKMRYKEITSEVGIPVKVQTNFYANSQKFDEIHTKDAHGYWSSKVEMFARAFACYVSDRVEGQSDYLCGHANLAVCSLEGKLIKAIPEGLERKVINQCMDNLIQDLKEIQLLNQYEYRTSLDQHLEDEKRLGELEMTDYRTYDNPLDTMEVIASNHKIHLDIFESEEGDLICTDDENNRWENKKIFEFFNEFLVDSNLCTKEQIQQINELSKGYGLQGNGYFDDFINLLEEMSLKNDDIEFCL